LTYIKRDIPARTIPGTTLLTRICFGASSVDNACVKASRAVLDNP
jgi:hypothetical protein